MCGRGSPSHPAGSNVPFSDMGMAGRVLEKFSHFVLECERACERACK